MRSHACRVVALVVTCVLTASIPSTAQVERCGPNDVVPWWPRFNAKVGSETLTAAERATVEARLAGAALTNNSTGWRLGSWWIREKD